MALELFLRALDAQLSHYSVPISERDRGSSGEICAAAILHRLRTVVDEFAERARMAGRKDDESMIDAHRR